MAGAQTKLESDVGTSYVATRSETGVLGCNGELIERRLGAGIKPGWERRGEAAGGQLRALATLPTEDNPQIYESSGEVNYRKLYGRHQAEIKGVMSYQDEVVRYGCASSVESRLRRLRGLRQGTVLLGRGLRTRMADIKLASGSAATRWSHQYTTTARSSDGDDTRHNVASRVERHWSESASMFASVRAGLASGVLDRYVDSGMLVGGTYFPQATSQLTTEFATDIRDDGGRTYSLLTSAEQQWDRQWKSYGKLVQYRYVQRDLPSFWEGEGGLTGELQSTDWQLAAHYTAFDDTAKSQGIWYTLNWEHRLTERQVGQFRLSHGSPYPDEAREVTTWLMGYGVQVGKIPTQPGMRVGSSRLNPRGGIATSYSTSRVVNQQGDVARVTQWTIALTGSF